MSLARPGVSESLTELSPVVGSFAPPPLTPRQAMALALAFSDGAMTRQLYEGESYHTTLNLHELFGVQLSITVKIEKGARR